MTQTRGDSDMRAISTRTHIRFPVLLALSAPAILLVEPALAQQAGDADVIEEVVVDGTRRTTQDSISLKPNSVAIVKGSTSSTSHAGTSPWSSAT